MSKTEKLVSAVIVAIAIVTFFGLLSCSTQVQITQTLDNGKNIAIEE